MHLLDEQKRNHEKEMLEAEIKFKDINKQVLVELQTIRVEQEV